MTEFDLSVHDWIGGMAADPESSATLASLRIKVGHPAITVTEIEDLLLSHTVRSHIYVPLFPVAVWFLANWWRLRWEPRPTDQARMSVWRQVHSMASIGGGYAWPALEFASDGEFINAYHVAEETADVSAIRYLRQLSEDIPAHDFEQAIDTFADIVQGRLHALIPSHRDIRELLCELREERANPVLAQACRLQALAGIDPGDASESWLEEAAKLGNLTGMTALDEVMAVLPSLGDSLDAAMQAVLDLRQSPIELDLTCATGLPLPSLDRFRPWKNGAVAAAAFRGRLGLGHGPISNKSLGDLLGVKLPLTEIPRNRQRSLVGGYRAGGNNGHARAIIPSPQPESQRFFLAKLIGCTLTMQADQSVLPVTSAGTALQKFERSFAQELLCPWTELEAFTDQHGTDAEGIADAAEYFNVSEWVVMTTLANKKVLSRDRLPNV
ncbi:MAG: hypothetical protein H7338_05290 [Candidatus Sericytochromatia bacterium]|nr:hypothetical protein [Candidatus Sericytochromatia bacterium]